MGPRIYPLSTEQVVKEYIKNFSRPHTFNQGGMEAVHLASQAFFKQLSNNMYDKLQRDTNGDTAGYYIGEGDMHRILKLQGHTNETTTTNDLVRRMLSRDYSDLFLKGGVEEEEEEDSE